MSEISELLRKSPNSGNSSPWDPTALLVSGSPAGVSPELLHALVCNADFILALDSGGEHLATAGILPDLLLGDLDSLSLETLAFFRTNDVPEQTYPAYKNATDVELGLEELHSRGYCRVIATNVLGGRTDHALGALGALAHAVYRWGMQLVLRDESELCFFVSCGDKEKVLELEYRDEALASITFTEAGQPCSVSPPYAPHARPLHVSLISWGGSSLVSIKGTEWELSHHTLSPDSSLGVSNILRSQSLRLTVHSGEGTVLLLLTF